MQEWVFQRSRSVKHELAIEEVPTSVMVMSYEENGSRRAKGGKKDKESSPALNETMTDAVLEVAGELVYDSRDWRVPLELTSGPGWIGLI